MASAPPPHGARHCTQTRHAKRLAQKRMKRRVFLGGLFASFLLLIIAAIKRMLAAIGNNAAPAVAEPMPEETLSEPEPTEDTRIIVALDAGHGGGDVGAMGIIDEYIMTHAIVDELYELFELDERFTPVVTHDIDGDYMLPSERAAVANALGAELLVSVHGNSDTSESTYGFECYTVTPGHALNEESLVFASYIVDEFEALGAKIRGANGIRYVYYDEENNRTMVESTDDTVRTDDTFTLLEDANCPAVLVQQCFVTSPTDVEMFCSDEGITMSANAYYKAICNYLQLTPTSV